ncbi:hypothetical protein L1987_04314 [Smallanthus sonchifolius]|uniref:Uncharacterized protein n=1 Tax=Smallanthus sonchifolius TaxID=185202 RepID=A0ACB9KDD4_9ASTR|nr:hypothetical protein L1987_04314 [Smallanthus sonchifolius]
MGKVSWLEVAKSSGDGKSGGYWLYIAFLFSVLFPPKHRMIFVESQLPREMNIGSLQAVGEKEEMEASYNAKIQQSKNSLGW